MAIGAASGLILGLWSFAGPLPVPEFLGAYDDTARRLARLGHIAWFGLGFINLAMTAELERSASVDKSRLLASRLMNIGNLALPTTLFIASVWQPFKYVMSVPALCVTIALILVAKGVRHDR